MKNNLSVMIGMKGTSGLKILNPNEVIRFEPSVLYNEK
jgi:hypothetical protein